MKLLSDANVSQSGRVPLESPFGKSNEPIAMKIIIFGMTSGYDIDSDNPTEGHSAWIQYALQNNPKTSMLP